MPVCEVWDLIKVPFPYTDRPVQQRRPALVVSVPETPRAPHLLWVLMVTSAANRGWPGDVTISDFETSGLTAPSVVRTAKIATIEAHDTERVGQLPIADRAEIAAAIAANMASVRTR